MWNGGLAQGEGKLGRKVIYVTEIVEAACCARHEVDREHVFAYCRRDPM